MQEGSGWQLGFKEGIPLIRKALEMAATLRRVRGPFWGREYFLVGGDLLGSRFPRVLFPHVLGTRKANEH